MGNLRTRPRDSRVGGIFTGLLVVGSAAGVVGWYIATNRAGPTIDATGFDLSVAPQSRRTVPALSGAPAPLRSGFGMIKTDPGLRIDDSRSGLGKADSPAPPKNGDKKSQARLDFTSAARKYESVVAAFSMRMTRKYPVIGQYGRDWMSYPDLRKLNNDYMRDRDPIAFLSGLAKAPNFGALVKKYAGAPEIREFITQGFKQSPGELTASALNVLQTDGVVKNVAANAVSGLGLPPSIALMISGGASKADPNQIMRDIMKNPDPRKTPLRQGQ